MGELTPMVVKARLVRLKKVKTVEVGPFLLMPQFDIDSTVWSTTFLIQAF
jgi:hypothetical protein